MALANYLGTALIPSFIAWGAISDANMKKQEGWNPTLAWGTAIATQGFNTLLSPWTYGTIVGVQGVAALTTMGLNDAYQRNNQAYQARMPFSHQFKHSQATSMLQQRGLQSIGGSWAHSRMGSEAGAMAQMYGRR